MEEKDQKPETKLDEVNRNIAWCVYQETNRELKSFKGNHNLIAYPVMTNQIKGDPVYLSNQEREMLIHQAIFKSENMFTYNEPEYPFNKTLAIIGILSLVVTISTFVNAITKGASSNITLNPLNSSQISDIKVAASALAFNLLYNTTKLNTFSYAQAEELINVALNKGIELTASELNNTLSLTSQTSSGYSVGQYFSIFAFVISAAVAIVSLALSVSGQKVKAQAAKEKEVYNMQKELIRREPKIIKEIAFKERVIRKMFLLLGEDVLSLSEADFTKKLIDGYYKLIYCLDHQDNLNSYSKLETKLDFLLSENPAEVYKQKIFNGLLEAMYTYFDENGYVLKKNIDNYRKFFGKDCKNFSKFYQKVDETAGTKLPTEGKAVFSYMYNTFETLVNKLESEFKLAKLDKRDDVDNYKILAQLSLFSKKTNQLIDNEMSVLKSENDSLKVKIQDLQNQLNKNKKPSEEVASKERLPLAPGQK